MFEFIINFPGRHDATLPHVVAGGHKTGGNMER